MNVHQARITPMDKHSRTPRSLAQLLCLAELIVMSVIHDENRDGELATNLMGVPKEGYGFSNDAKASLGAPSFEAASFSYNGQSLKMTIALQY